MSTKPLKNKCVLLTFLGLLMLSACNPFGKESKVGTGWFGIGRSPELTLDDDSANNLSWQGSTTVKGSKFSPTITGTCTNGIATVDVLVNFSLRFSVTCSNERFSVPLTGSNAFSANGSYVLEFRGKGAGISTVVVTRNYDLNYIDPATMVTFNSFPSTTIYATENLTGTCNVYLTLTIAGNSFSCSASQNFNESLSLSLGSNSILVSWTDEYSNSGSQTFAITRNAAGVPELTIGMSSSVPSGTVNLTNITSGTAALAPKLDLSSNTSTSNGVTSANIPLSIAPSAGAAGLRMSIGNHSYVFCENQNGSGECVP